MPYPENIFSISGAWLRQRKDNKHFLNDN